MMTAKNGIPNGKEGLLFITEKGKKKSEGWTLIIYTLYT